MTTMPTTSSACPKCGGRLTADNVLACARSIKCIMCGWRKYSSFEIRPATAKDQHELKQNTTRHRRVNHV